MQPEDKKKNKSRRRFLNTLLGTSFLAFIASVIYPVWQFLIPPKVSAEAVPNSVMAGTLDTLKLNSGKIIKYGSKPVILIRTDHNEIRAFSAVCTHLECIVQYRGDLKQIWCACHNGHYDLNGINIAGPPPRRFFACPPLAGFFFIKKKEHMRRGDIIKKIISDFCHY